jgi:hypothetical protein
LVKAPRKTYRVALTKIEGDPSDATDNWTAESSVNPGLEEHRRGVWPVTYTVTGGRHRAIGRTIAIEATGTGEDKPLVVATLTTRKDGTYRKSSALPGGPPVLDELRRHQCHVRHELETGLGRGTLTTSSQRSRSWASVRCHHSSTSSGLQPRSVVAMS